MAALNRQEKIRELIRSQGSVRVTELSEQCKVTEETIRKDLDKLEKEGILLRVHGGAVLTEQTAVNEVSIPSELSHFEKRRSVNLDSKKRIAGNAVSLLKDVHTLFVDSSTTAAEVVYELFGNSDITIVTNSAQFFAATADVECSIISTGGEFNPTYMSLQGTIAKETINKYNVDAAVISCKAIDPVDGAQDTYDAEAELKKIMIERSSKVILLADHSKFNQKAFVKLMNLDAVDILVTDEDPGEQWRNICVELGIQLYY